MTRAAGQRRVSPTLRARSCVLAIVLPTLATGCSASAEHAEPVSQPVTHTLDPAALTFSYEGTAAPGYMDQTLTIDNANSASVALTAELTPLDAGGAPLPDVAVETVYGSDRGRLVLPPATTSTSSCSTAPAPPT